MSFSLSKRKPVFALLNPLLIPCQTGSSVRLPWPFPTAHQWETKILNLRKVRKMALAHSLLSHGSKFSIPPKIPRNRQHLLYIHIP